MTAPTPLIPRTIENDIYQWLDAREIIALRGSRQSGKTTLLYQIQILLEKKHIEKKNIHFITMEDDFEKEKFEKNPQEYIRYFIADSKARHFFLFDEIQYVKRAGKLLKLIYDVFENVKMIMTGSSTLDLNEVGSALVGRVIFFELYPFSFEEFLRAKDEKAYRYYQENKFRAEQKNLPSTLFIDTLNAYLAEYIAYGGYPRVVLEKDRGKKKTLLKNLYLTYVEKDIVKVYGLKYKQKVSELMKYLAALNSNMLSYEDICSTTNLYFKEVKEIIGVLEQTYILKTISPFHKNVVTELKKNQKLYFLDTGLRNFIVNRFDFSDEEFGKLLENHVFNALRGKDVHYWRTTAKAEVDFIVHEGADILPIEVKLRPKITRSLRSFLHHYRPPRALLGTLHSSARETIDGTTLWTTPVALL